MSECKTCRDIGWITVDNVTGDPWDIPCPENCPATALPDDSIEVPF